MHKAKTATNMLKSFHNTLTTVKPVLVATSVKQAAYLCSQNKHIQSNFNGLNTFGTMKISSRHG